MARHYGCANSFASTPASQIRVDCLIGKTPDMSPARRLLIGLAIGAAIGATLPAGTVSSAPRSDHAVVTAQAMIPPTGMGDADKAMAAANMAAAERMNRRHPQPVR